MSNFRVLSSILTARNFFKVRPLLQTESNRLKLIVENKANFSLSKIKQVGSESGAETGAGRALTEGEQKLTKMLKERFPNAQTIEVNDISGGCGSMYAIYVESLDFKGLRTVKQHQMINECLKDEIKNKMHGIRIYTAVPEK